jgi:predicted Zn finger-like uncharacterized protein
MPTSAGGRKESKSQPQTISIRCGQCSTAIDAPVSKIGQTVRCPDCHSPIPVQPKVVKKRTGSANDALQTRKAHRALDSSPDSFGFSCSLCGTRLYANESLIGTKLACPDCHSEVLVRKGPAAVGSGSVVTPPAAVGDKDDLRLEDVAERPTYQPTDRGKMSTRDMQILKRPQQKQADQEDADIPSSDSSPLPDQDPSRPAAGRLKRADFEAACPECHARLGLRAEQIGKIVRCGDCHHKFMVRP